MRFAWSGKHQQLLERRDERPCPTVMFRARAFVTIALLIFAIYTFSPAERKKRWIDKLRELSKSLVLSLVIYWIYMLALYFLRPG